MFRLTFCASSKVVENAYEYARMAGAGFRPARIRSLPDAVWDLISAAWHDDPLERPPMSVIVERLQARSSAVCISHAVRCIVYCVRYIAWEDVMQGWQTLEAYMTASTVLVPDAAVDASPSAVLG